MEEEAGYFTKEETQIANDIWRNTLSLAIREKQIEAIMRNPYQNTNDLEYKGGFWDGGIRRELTALV